MTSTARMIELQREIRAYFVARYGGEQGADARIAELRGEGRPPGLDEPTGPSAPPLPFRPPVEPVR